MKTPDEFSDYHKDLLEGSYDCIDRIVLNAYFRMGQTGGGFRVWWRDLNGGDEVLDRAHIERMAGRFKRRIQAYSKQNNIPFIHCEMGERKHVKAEEFLPKDPLFKGVFLILVGRAPAPIWEVRRNGKGEISNIFRKEKWPYVNHYYFHLMDPEWGHLTIRMCGYPPFGTQVILNGHEWVERRAWKQSLPVNKEGNCFTGGNDYQALDQIAKTLCAEHTIGRLAEVCDRWLYSSCLCFALDLAEQKRSRFHYEYSIFQIEYSRNLLFERGTTMEEVYQKLLDRTRSLLDVKTLKTIFGWKARPTHRLKRGTFRVDQVIERPCYDLTVFKIHFGKLSLKIYDKGDRVLRIEAIAHNVKELRCGKRLEKLPEVLSKMQTMVVDFLNIVQAAHISFLDEGAFDSMVLPTQRGNRRLAGIDLNKSRIRNVVDAVVALSPQPDGFSVRDLAQKVQAMTNAKTEDYGIRHAAYDLAKLRGKHLIDRVEHSRRYVAKPQSIRTLCAYMTIREKVIKPVLAGASRNKIGPSPRNIAPLDVHYQNLHQELEKTFETLGLIA